MKQPKGSLKRVRTGITVIKKTLLISRYYGITQKGGHSPIYKNEKIRMARYLGRIKMVPCRKSSCLEIRMEPAKEDV